MRPEYVGTEEIYDEEDEGEDETEISGDDLEAMLGASPFSGSLARLKRGRGNMPLPMRRRLPPGPGPWGPPPPPYGGGQPGRDSRALLIGFSSLAVAASGTVTVSVSPQLLFRPTRLVVAGSVAPSFTIDDIKIGNRSQFIAAGSVPAEAFGPNAVNTPLRMDTCQVSMSIILQVTNISLAACDFRAAMFGDAVY